ACTRLAKDPAAFLATQDALAPVRDVLAWRQRKVEIERLGVKQPHELPPPQRIASFQCLIAGDGQPEDRTATLDGETFPGREARTPKGSDQIQMNKALAALFAEGFGYGHLTSNQALDAAPAEATIAKNFSDPAYLMTKLELLRDADLFL